MENQILPAVPSNKSFDLNDFLSFRTMITLKVIPILYAVIAVIITLASLGMMFSGGSRRGYSDSPFSMLMPGGFIGGLVFLIIGNIIWRMWCEFILVLFRVNKNLQDIERHTRP